MCLLAYHFKSINTQGAECRRSNWHSMLDKSKLMHGVCLQCDSIQEWQAGSKYWKTRFDLSLFRKESDSPTYFHEPYVGPTLLWRKLLKQVSQTYPSRNSLQPRALKEQLKAMIVFSRDSSTKIKVIISPLLCSSTRWTPCNVVSPWNPLPSRSRCPSYSRKWNSCTSLPSILPLLHRESQLHSWVPWL